MVVSARVELESGIVERTFRTALFALTAGLHRPGAARGIWIELAFRVLAGGLWGSLLQVFRTAQPAWLAGLGVAVVAPGSIHVLEFALLRAGHAAGIRAGMIVSVGLSGVSLLANWGLMRRGLLLTGKGSLSLGGDLRRFPAVVSALFTGRQSEAREART